jgi:hypothetical protein
MKKNTFIQVITLLICSIIWNSALSGDTPVYGTDSPAALESATLKGSGTIAVGNFVNVSTNRGYDYLESILPTALAGSLDSKFRISTIKPRVIEEVIKNKLQREYTEQDLYNISSQIKAEYFVFGSFEPLSDNRIKTVINIYKVSSSNIFTFTDIGYLEVELFRLIDKLSLNVKNITDPVMFYKSESIRPDSRLAVLTNLNGEDLNSLYYEILNRGHRLNSFQGNSIYNNINTENINKFYFITSNNASYRKIYYPEEIKLIYGTWAGSGYYSDLKNKQKIYERFTFNFNNTGQQAFSDITKAAPRQIDYLLIIGFNDNRNEAWIRCINLKTGNLIFTESAISGSSIEDITRKIMGNISES